MSGYRINGSKTSKFQFCQYLVDQVSDAWVQIGFSCPVDMVRETRSHCDTVGPWDRVVRQVEKAASKPERKP